MEKEKKASKYTEAKKRNNRNWDAANLDRLSVAAPKGTKDRWKAAAKARGQSLNQFIVDSVEADISIPRSSTEHPQEGGGLQLSPEAEKAAQEAAEATGEALPQFIERAVVTQAQRDKTSFRMGINPVAKENPQA